MQISSISTSLFTAAAKVPTSPGESVNLDQAVMDNSPDSFSSLVAQARQYPEVRSDVVDAFKARIQSGSYPSSEVIANLARVLGGGIAQMALSDSSPGQE